MLVGIFGIELEKEIDASTLNRHELGEAIYERLKAAYEVKEQILGAPQLRYHERIVMLSVVDGLWKDHLLAMDHLKEGIGLRGYAQLDPLVEYKRESYIMFEEMMKVFQQDTVRYLFRMQILGPDGQPVTQVPVHEVAVAGPSASLAGDIAMAKPVGIPTKAPTSTIDELEREFKRKKEKELAAARQAGGAQPEPVAQRRAENKVGRNDPCPCGSGKKYKKCHGASEG
jgi:preprotein translocase subunit SecA